VSGSTTIGGVDYDPALFPAATGGPSLLDQAARNPVNALMSLLTPAVTGGAMAPQPESLLTPGEQTAALPGWLAAAAALARAGEPTLGPKPTTAGAIIDAMSAGYGATRQAQAIPYLQAAAARESQAQDLALQQRQFEFDREKQLNTLQLNMLAGTGPLPGAGPAGATPPPGGTAGAPAVPASPAAPAGVAATAQQIAQLPDVQNLPDQTRVPAIMAMQQAGMGLDEAAQYARMLKQESGGLHIDPKTGNPITSSKGAVGTAQVMPATFADMAQKYGIQGNNTDLMPNLLAGAHYFHEGVLGGDLHSATIRYSAGPGGLATYQNSGQLPAETSDYLAKTNAPLPTGATAMVADASGRVAPVFGPGGPPAAAGAPGTPAGGPGPAPLSMPPGATGTIAPNDPMIVDPLTRATIPQSIAQSARAAMVGALSGPPGAGLAAYQKTVNDYLQNRAQQQTKLEGETWQPTATPGVQRNPVTGETRAAPAGTPTEQIMTPDQVAAIPSLDPRMTYSQTVRPDGSIEKYQVIAPRQAFAQLDQEKNMRQEYLDDPVVKTYQGALPYLTRMQGILAQGQQRELQQPDDYALLKNYAHLNDPNRVVKSGDEDSVYQGAGIPGDIKQAWARVAGGGTLLPEQRQWLLDSARSEMGGQEAAAYQTLLEKRRLAEAQGIRPDQIAIPWNLSSYARTALAATPAGAATPGTPTGTAGLGGNPALIPRPGVVPSVAPLPGGRQIAAQAGGAPPAPAVPGATPTPPAIAPGAVTPQALQGLPDATLKGFASGIGRNGPYSDRELGMIAAELRRRRGS
jgi:hypothetical protein